MGHYLGYTLATAALYLLNGWRRVVGLALIALIVGPTVVLLSPLWFAGVLAYEIHRRWLFRDGVTSVEYFIALLKERYRVILSRNTVERLALGIVIAVFPIWAVFELLEWGPELYAWSKGWISYEWRQHLGMAKRYAWQWAYIPGLLALMVFARLILDGPASPGVLKVASTASKYAFPVYAIHFTLLLSVTAYMEPLHVHLNGARGCAA